MSNPLAWGKRASLLLVLPSFVLPLLLGEHRSSVRVLSAPQRLAAPRQPQFTDWSTRHTLYSRYATMDALEAAGRDPRAQFHWRSSNQQSQLSRFAAAQDQLRSL